MVERWHLGVQQEPQGPPARDLENVGAARFIEAGQLAFIEVHRHVDLAGLEQQDPVAGIRYDQEFDPVEVGLGPCPRRVGLEHDPLPAIPLDKAVATVAGVVLSDPLVPAWVVLGDVWLDRLRVEYHRDLRPDLVLDYRRRILERDANGVVVDLLHLVG